MRPLGVVFAVVVGVGALSAMVWLGRYSPYAERHERTRMRWEEGTWENQKENIANSIKEHSQKRDDEKRERAKRVEDRPPIADKPPFPRVKTGERIYEFGSMGVNEEKKHTFHIQNIGQGPLRIAKGQTTCKCTISKVAKNELGTGESVDVELSWTPKEVTQTFAQHATIYTNDPELPEFQFKIYGKVVNLYALSPEGTWYAGHITDIQDGKVVGTLTSPVEANFKITSIENSDPKHVKVEQRRLSGRELMRNGGSKCGYELTVSVDNSIPIGLYKGQLKLHTTLEGNKTVEVDVRAQRAGPIVFLPPVSKTRSSWSGERSLINMGPFRHDMGAKVALPALIYGMKEKFQVLAAETGVNFIKVSVEPKPETGPHAPDQQRVDFVFEVPAGAPPITRITPNDITAKLRTNHPKLKEMEFKIGVVSQ